MADEWTVAAYGAPVTSGSDPRVTRNADMQRTSEAELDVKDSDL